MKQILKILAILLLCSPLCSCAFGNGDIFSTLKAKVYIGGSINGQACYWVDDGMSITRVDLAGTTPSEVLDIKVKDGVVYAAGYYGDGPACFWKGGDEPVKLSSETGDIANSILIINGDIYIGGAAYNGYTNACVWKNGTPVFLSSAMSSVVNHLVCNNGKIYAAGMEQSMVSATAHIWILDADCSVSDELNYTSMNSTANNICFIGNTIYAAGENTGTQCHWIVQGTTWNIVEGDTLANRVINFNGSPLFAGSDKSSAAYRYNGTVYYPGLTGLGGVSMINSVVTAAGNLLSCGYDYDESVICYWYNNTQVILEEKVSSASAGCITVSYE